MEYCLCACGQGENMSVNIIKWLFIGILQFVGSGDSQMSKPWDETQTCVQKYYVIFMAGFAMQYFGKLWKWCSQNDPDMAGKDRK